MFLRRLRLGWCGALAATALFGVPGAKGDPAVPVIEHAPVRTAAPGQSITVRARVAGPVPSSMTLYFATSKDAAPFKLPMASSGPGVYAGTIPDSMLARLSEVYYYIEARDASDAPVETPWYTVQIRPGEQKSGAVGASKGATPDSEKSSWVKPALIAGGILAAGGVAYAISDSGGGGGGDDDGGGGSGPTPLAGTYRGSDTTCFQPAGGATGCESSGLTITITEQGVVQSDDLLTGTRLEAALSGVNFVLVGDLGSGGQVQYLGTVVDNRIVGSIQGSLSSSNGAGTVSGSFSAVK